MPFCPQAVIFDMDGLLVDSEPVWALAERAVVEARGVVHNLALQDGLVGLRLDEYWNKMAAIYTLTDSIPVLIEDIVTRMQTLIPQQVETRPGAVELLTYLHERKVPIAIASSSPISIIDSVVDSKGWRDIFAVRVSGDEVAAGKPAPDVYLEAARRLGADPRTTLALEDSVNGARAAVAAGMICYAVPDLSHAKPEYFANITPHVFDSLHEVLVDLKSCGF
ncbi:MAG: HAD family phosphatase [Anaerolineae bacterium]